MLSANVSDFAVVEPLEKGTIIQFCLLAGLWFTLVKKFFCITLLENSHPGNTIMEARLWDPERLSNIASVMSRYSQQLNIGDFIRLGIEGDPCYSYRSVDDAPVAKVRSLDRSEDGFVSFEAEITDANGQHDEQKYGQVVQLDNRRIDPKQVWEIPPFHLDTFRGRVLKETAKEEEEEVPQVSVPEAESELMFRNASESTASSWMTRLESLEKMVGKMADKMERTSEYRGALQNVANLEHEIDVLRKDTLLAVRELCGDVLRTYRGERAEFAETFANRYDSQEEEKHSSQEEEKHSSQEAGSDLELEHPESINFECKP